MKLARFLPSLMAATASLCYASPTPVLDLAAAGSPDTELLVREGIKLARSLDIEKRVQADFPLDKTWNNEVLFGGSWNDTHPGSSEQAELSVTCLECYTRGTVSAKLEDHDLFHPSLKLGFSGVEAYANLGVAASAGQTFSLNLFASNTPIGIGITGLDVGVVFFVDLVFSLSDPIDLTAGFQVTVPDDAFLEADLFGGDISDSSFGGLNSQALPVTVVSGTATFKADLRLRVQAGAEASLPFFDIGAGAVVGIYANLIEFVAVIEETPTCPLETEIWWDLNVGAYAHLDVVVDYTTLGPVPTISTTLLTAPTLSSCYLAAGTTTTSEVSGTLIATTAPSATTSSPAETGDSSSSSLVTSVPTTVTLTTLTSSPSLSTSISVPVSNSVTVSDSYSSSPPLSTDSSPAYQYPTYSYISSPYSSYPYPTYSYSSEPYSSEPYSSAPYSSAPYSSAPYSSAPAYPSSGPTYTSTYTHTLTRCGCEGVMNCPSDYQTEVVVTRTTTVCPAANTAISAPIVTAVPGSYPTGHQGHGQSVVVVVMTPLPTPIVATFVAPPPTTTPGHIKGHTDAASSQGHAVIETAAAAATETGNDAAGQQPDYTYAATTATETATHGKFHTPGPSPSPSVHVHGHGHGHGNATVVSTGTVPAATQSGIPVTAGAGRFSALGSAYGSAATLVIALAMGVLVL